MMLRYIRTCLWLCKQGGLSAAMILTITLTIIGMMLAFLLINYIQGSNETLSNEGGNLFRDEAQIP